MLFVGGVRKHTQASVIPSASRVWRRAVQADLSVFHSTLRGSAIADLSPAMGRRVFAISGARRRLLWIGSGRQAIPSGRKRRAL